MNMIMLMGMSTSGMGVMVNMETGRVTAHCPSLIHGVEVFAGFGQEIPVMGNDHIGNIDPVENVNQPGPGFRVKVVGRLIQQHGFRMHGQDGGK